MPDAIKDAIARRTRTLVSQAGESRGALQHDGLYGENNEGLLIDVLRALLPGGWSVDGGEIVDTQGNISPQCDVIVYSRATFPPIYVGPTGRVSVPAHAVGAVVEVKSTLHNSGEVKSLCDQIKGFVDFLNSALDCGDPALLEEAGEQAASDDVKKELSSLSGSRIPVFGFAYESRIQADTVRNTLLLREQADPIFILDVPRPWDAIKKDFGALGAAPTRDDVERFVDDMRAPNGFSFHVDLYVQNAASTLKAQEHGHASNALGLFVKEISDRVRTQSPMPRHLSPRAAEIAYSAYHRWTGAYV
jgi:hypothetical protein